MQDICQFLGFQGRRIHLRYYLEHQIKIVAPGRRKGAGKWLSRTAIWILLNRRFSGLLNLIPTLRSPLFQNCGTWKWGRVWKMTLSRNLIGEFSGLLNSILTLFSLSLQNCEICERRRGLEKERCREIQCDYQTVPHSILAPKRWHMYNLEVQMFILWIQFSLWEVVHFSTGILEYRKLFFCWEQFIWSIFYGLIPVLIKYRFEWFLGKKLMSTQRYELIKYWWNELFPRKKISGIPGYLFRSAHLVTNWTKFRKWIFSSLSCFLLFHIPFS